MEATRTESAEETEAVAAALAGELRAGDVVVLRGDLGAGKTTFVRGAARALGVQGPVTSPTFTIGRLYATPAGPDLAHLDLYRLGSLEDEEPGFLDDYVNPSSIAFVEWPDVAAGEFGRPAAEVLIEHAGGDVREIEVRR